MRFEIERAALLLAASEIEDSEAVLAGPEHQVEVHEVVRSLGVERRVGCAVVRQRAVPEVQRHHRGYDFVAEKRFTNIDGAAEVFEQVGEVPPRETGRSQAAQVRGIESFESAEFLG